MIILIGLIGVVLLGISLATLGSIDQDKDNKVQDIYCIHCGELTEYHNEANICEKEWTW